MITRRGFLKGLMTSVAAVAISTRLASSTPKLAEPYRWGIVNEDYSYGINPDDPLDVVIFDEREQSFVEPEEMELRENALEAVAVVCMSQAALVLKQGGRRLADAFGEGIVLLDDVFEPLHIRTHRNTVLVD